LNATNEIIGHQLVRSNAGTANRHIVEEAKTRGCGSVR
jgi:hypothetical protein